MKFFEKKENTTRIGTTVNDTAFILEPISSLYSDVRLLMKTGKVMRLDLFTVRSGSI
jgi:hypothetical protein